MWASFENNWTLFLRECAKRKKQILTTHNTFMKTHIFQQTIHQLPGNISRNFFELQGVGWDLSMMRISYKLTKRTTKTEKLKKIVSNLRLFPIIWQN